MGTKQLAGCALPPTGSVFYRDPTGALYEANWFTTFDAKIDVTTITKQPYVWGEDPSLPAAPPVRAGALWRRGTITVQRQILATHPAGYLIVSEGVSQVVTDYQDSFPCGPQPQDRFCYHLDSALVADVESRVTQGARWTDPAQLTAEAAGWIDPAQPTAGAAAAGDAGFGWIDVWQQ